ncbi:MAG: iron ABC transporter permease [Actinobacteria bacterium]|nr:iron ABC transporter permease [Actinomycetota bacterium]
MAVESLGEGVAPRVEARGVGPRWGLAVGALLVGALLVGLGVGPVGIGFGDIVRSALSAVPLLHVHSPLSAVQHAVLWQLRAPRVVLAALVGGMLAVAGSAYQGVFRNPLADPYLLGVAGGAGLGATIAIVYGLVGSGARWGVPAAAFAGAIAAVVATYVLGRSAGQARTSGALVLAGVTIATFTAAVQTFIQQLHTDQLQNVYAWLLGGFSTASWRDVAVASPYIALSAVVLVLHRRVLDVLSLGDDEAASLGVDVARVRLVVVVAATLGTAAAVSVSGLIAFVGIIVPHTIRLLVSTSYRAVVPLSLAVGAAFLVLTDVLARTVLSPSELPIGVVTAFFGAPFFAVVLRSARTMR